MWVHPKLHGYTFIYPQLQGSTPHNITGIFLCTHNHRGVPPPHNITGILLYTHNHRDSTLQYHGYTFIYPQTKCVYEIPTSDDVLLAMTEGTPLQRHSIFAEAKRR